jgi:pimeloyl-ACP methyl ester carboxylesterase
MKKLTSVFALVFITASIFAQSKFIGNWQGSVNVGKKLRLVFHVTPSGDTVISTMDSPDQGVTGITCERTYIEKDSILFDMSNMGIEYAGELKGDSIVGTWFQKGLKIAITFYKTDKTAELYRPQTPKPPFSYESEDVIYFNTDNSIQYGATITKPMGKGPFPAVLLITGSGQQNRDEELFGHKPFAVIADFLTKRGYLVMRVDDRGVDKSTGDYINATTLDFAGDVNTSIDYLKTRSEVNKNKIVLIGHSEGAIIAPMVASKRKDIDAIVMMAGAGEKISKLMLEQSAAIIESVQPDTEMIRDFKRLYKSMEDVVLNAKDSDDAKNKVTLTLDLWLKQVKPDMAREIGITSNETKDQYIASFTEMYTNPWLRYFLSMDPVPYLEHLSCKVLALGGSRDIQVIAKSNLAGIKQALTKSKSKTYEVKELPGLNHLFQHCKTCTSGEYGELTETIAPEALNMIGDWLDKNVKAGS